jgi:hypothetical protein
MQHLVSWPLATRAVPTADAGCRGHIGCAWQSCCLFQTAVVCVDWVPHCVLCSSLYAAVVFLCCLPQACEVLARAMKEWDRRRGERTGFNNSPGDCMAFKYLRDVSSGRYWVPSVVDAGSHIAQ